MQYNTLHNIQKSTMQCAKKKGNPLIDFIFFTWLDSWLLICLYLTDLTVLDCLDCHIRYWHIASCGCCCSGLG